MLLRDELQDSGMMVSADDDDDKTAVDDDDGGGDDDVEGGAMDGVGCKLLALVVGGGVLWGDTIGETPN